MKRKYFLRGASALAIIVVLLLSATPITANNKESNNKTNPVEELLLYEEQKTTADRGIVFQDDFESYADFVLDFPPWIQVDVDGAATYGMTNYDYPNEYYVGSFMIFNPSQTTPPCPDAPPHSGDKFAACFNAVLPASNDDWLITPQLSSAQFGEVSFWARSYTDAYNLDRFQVGISTTDTNPASFTIISTGAYIEAPIVWTQYTYDLSAYSGDIYIAIHCVSNDAFILMVDDFMVTDETSPPPVPAICCEGELAWPSVKAGATVTGEFEVCNCGEEGSLLNWEVASFPTWGTWTIVPDSGEDLLAGDCVTVNVTVVAPAEKKKTFTGTVKLINVDNPDDFCEIDVSLTTPRARFVNNPLFFRILERFESLFTILKILI